MGKLTAIAKGSLRTQSTQALALDEGNIIRCELVAGRSGPIITGAQTLRAFPGAKGGVAHWAAAQFFLQVLQGAVYDEQSDPHLWACACGALHEIDAASRGELLGVFRSQQAKALEALGYGASGDDASRNPSTGRSPFDDRFEQIAQRSFSSLDLLYDALRATSIS
ncbi:MAG: hypothetical protein IT406_00605 [Candidatus Yanofskybacteria bacterium]|nr:hypothetical protein [Candidatus Yanofskybacteria bacterium]